VYRRNPNEVTKIACLADRRNVLRVVVRNHSSEVAGPLDVDATIDGSTRVRGTLAPVARLQEQHLQMDIPVTLRAGTHRVEVRLTSSADSSQVFHRAEAEFVCQPD
jgi:hypothetical protein